MKNRVTNEEPDVAARRLDREALSPLLDLLRDPSEPVRAAILRIWVLLLPRYPELTPEVEGCLTRQSERALLAAAGDGPDRDVHRAEVGPRHLDTTRGPGNPARLQEKAGSLADAYLDRLAAGEFDAVYLPTADLETLSHLDPERATRLSTALFSALLKAAIDDRDTGYMAGNEVARFIASFGAEFVPDIPGLFAIYLAMHEQVSPARAKWYQTGDDHVLFFSTNYLAVGWQLAWTLSRAGMRDVLIGLTPSLSARDADKRLAAVELLEDVIRYEPVVDPPQFGGGSGPPGRNLTQDIPDTVEPAVSPSPPPPSSPSPSPSPSLAVSVAYPKQFSKRFSSPFKVTLYPPEQQDEAHAQLRRGFEASDIETIPDEETDLIHGMRVVIQLSSPDIAFDAPVTKQLKRGINTTAFTAKPVDGCHPGKHTVKLAITDTVEAIEYLSHTFEITIVDFAFDHVSRPLLQRTISVALGAGALAMFVLTLLSKIDTTFGLASGSAAGLLAGGVYLRFLSFYRQLKTTTTA